MARKKPVGWKQPRVSPLLVRGCRTVGKGKPIGISDNLNNLNKLFKAVRQANRRQVA
jgi:hypothetical protein